MKIHFIGISGIGVSALAKYYSKKGHKISGSDIAFGKHSPKNIPQNANLVIYSPAVKSDNPEIKEAKKRKIKIQSYPEALGELTKKYFTIAVSGTHGKSTTAAMIGLILAKAGLDPTVIVGTKLKEFAPHQKNGEGSNCRVGKSKYLVIEADEHMASFLNYWPKIIVITNIEKEHLDYYKNLGNILKTYKKFVGHLPENGVLIKDVSKFKKEAKKLKKILKIPGEHNINNALDALVVARVLKIPDKISFKALSEYRGSWRRFEIKQLTINNKQLTIISDYAHHPTEIKATLKAAREKFPKKKIWCIFQPHQHQRTFYLFKDFVKVFKEALQQAQGKLLIDRLIITDIYDVAGREKKRIKEKVSSEKLVKRIMNCESGIKNNIIYIPTIKGAGEYLKENLKGKEVVIIMGAGNIYTLVDFLA